MQVPAECLASARRGRAADLRVIYQESIWQVHVLVQYNAKLRRFFLH